MNASLLSLKNGEPLAVAEMPWMESVAVGVWARVGARHDPARLPGLAHFAEHLIFKGTEKRDAHKLAREVESVGGSVEAYTSEEQTCFYIRGPAEHFARFADVLIDMYLHSTYPEEEVTRECEVISEEISMYQEQPTNLVEDKLCEALWPGHVLARPISGDEKSVRRIRRQHLTAHARQYFSRSSSVLAVAGRIETAQVRETLQTLLPHGLPRGRPTSSPKPSALRGPNMRIVAEQTDQSQIALGFRTPGRNRINAYALRLLNILLGENTSSLLWQELRESRGWCYAIDTDPTILSDTGAFQIFAGVDPVNLEKSFALILKCLRRFSQKPVSPSLLNSAREYAIGSARIGLESTTNQLAWIAESTLLHRRIIPPQEAADKLRRVTPSDIQQLAASIFRTRSAALAIVGPSPQADRLRQLLLAGL